MAEKSLFAMGVSVSHHLSSNVQTHWHLLGHREATAGNPADCLHKGCVWLHLQAGVSLTPAAAKFYGVSQQQSTGNQDYQDL